MASLRQMRIGIDIGGTKLLGVALAPDGEIVAHRRVPTPPGVDDLVDVLVALIESFGPALSVGIGVPGLMSADGTVRATAHLEEVRNFALGAVLKKRLAPLGLDDAFVIENDATATTVAEWQLGAGRGVDDLVVVTLGTGIGGGFVFGGRVYRGAHGHAGELGHVVVEAQGRWCDCGRRGCWERYASGTALADTAGCASGEEAVAAYRSGDARAVHAFDELTRWVGIGLANLVNSLDPARIVVGGGLVALGDELLEPARAQLAASLYATDHREIPPVVPAELGIEAGAVGAALLPALTNA